MALLIPGADTFAWHTPQPPFPIRKPAAPATIAMVSDISTLPAEEEEDDKAAIKDKLPPWLKPVMGFFSKRASRQLPDSSSRDVVLKLRKPMPTHQNHYYRTPPALLPVVNEAIEQYLADGFISRENVEHAAPSMLVPKRKNPRPVKEDWRFCIDYRLTNQSLEPIFCPMPHLSDTKERIRKAKYLTKIDIRQAFHRMRLSPECRIYTAFKTRQGTFVWNVLPFGLQAGPAWFQQLINSLLRDALDIYATAYADDVLIYSETKKSTANMSSRLSRDSFKEGYKEISRSRNS